MLKLLLCPELDLRVSDIELDAEQSHTVQPGRPPRGSRPKYDPVAMVSDMVEVLNGEGGQVEQTLLLLRSAAAQPTGWPPATRLAYVATYRTSFPFAPIARHVERTSAVTCCA